ncbi:phosphotransferase-like protein [Halocatena salina]|uniref:Uncharacterized protein n=1 Tax=Halocatena salina TaxID=2934340 RepID=A0A8U0A802_9EURY|nr:hypothetical protein [Halocatena salina]UPM44628.1 hypothetical protein MW046_16420 [Halocatena salina]
MFSRHASGPDLLLDVGFSRQQFDEFHAGVEYGMEVNTERATPAKCAEQIAAHYEDLSQWQRGPLE